MLCYRASRKWRWGRAWLVRAINNLFIHSQLAFLMLQRLIYDKTGMFWVCSDQRDEETLQKLLETFPLFHQRKLRAQNNCKRA